MLRIPVLQTKPPRWNRIHMIEQLRFLSSSCRQTSFLIIELGYFHVSILMSYSFKKFKRLTVTMCLQALLFSQTVVIFKILFLIPASKNC